MANNNQRKYKLQRSDQQFHFLKLQAA